MNSWNCIAAVAGSNDEYSGIPTRKVMIATVKANTLARPGFSSPTNNTATPPRIGNQTTRLSKGSSDSMVFLLPG